MTPGQAVGAVIALSVAALISPTKMTYHMVGPTTVAFPYMSTPAASAWILSTAGVASVVATAVAVGGSVAGTLVIPEMPK